MHDLNLMIFKLLMFSFFGAMGIKNLSTVFVSMREASGYKGASAVVGVTVFMLGMIFFVHP